MGRQLHGVKSGAQFEDYHPSCLWSLLHILDHHHKNHPKKNNSHKKKRNERTHARSCCGNPKTSSMEHDNFGARSGLLDTEANEFLNEEHPTKVSPIDNHLKALVNEDMSKEENHSHWVLGFSTESKIQQTHSIHHLEPSDYRFGKISNDWANPIIILHKNANASASELQFSSLKKTHRKLVSRSKQFDVCDGMNPGGRFEQYPHPGKYAGVRDQKVMETSKSLNQVDDHHWVKESVDVLEILKGNKELFLDILQDPGIAASKQCISNRKAKLTKSGSFPVADNSPVRYLKPSTLEHKQSETWIFPKTENWESSTKVSKGDAVRSEEAYNEKRRLPLADEGADSNLKHERSTTSWSSSRVIGHLRDIKQKIKHAIKESKKERVKLNTDALSQRASSTSASSTDGKKMPENISTIHDGPDNSTRGNETDGFDHNLSNSELHRMKRTASLNESMDRYAPLFDSNLSREAKLPHSKSLRLRNEDTIASRYHAPKFFRRISSLSDVESFYSLVHEVLHDSEKPVNAGADFSRNAGSYTHSDTKSNSLLIDTGKSEPLDTVVEINLEKNVDEGRSEAEGLAENLIEPETSASYPREDHETDMTNFTLNLALPSLVSQTEFVHTAECPILEGSESNPLGIDISDADPSNALRKESEEASLRSLCSKVYRENDFHDQRFELDNNEASFNYVRDMLQISGFTENESRGRWYSLEQPLDPELFKEVETDLHHQVNYSEEFGGNCDHRLLFDLINEVLLEMYETSFAYFPTAFSFNQRIRPLPRGHRVIDEVWSRICRCLSFKSDLDRSLGDIVSQDLANGDGWTNHQFQTECVALELEDLIFDGLLQEVLCS